MAVIQKRVGAKGETKYRVLVRKAGHPPVSKTFLKYDLANKFANKTENDLEEGVFKSDKAVLSDVIATSFRVLKMGVDKTKMYKQIDRRFGHFALRDLTRDIYFAYANERKNHVKASTINHTFSYLRTLLNFAENYMRLKPELQEFNAARSWLHSEKFLTKSDRRTRRVTQAEIEAIEQEWLLDDFQGSQTKPWSLSVMMRFALLSCMRRGEQFSLRWDEFDADQRTVGVWRKHPQKGKVYSRVPLLKEAAEIIQQQERKGDLIFNVTSNHAAKIFRRYTKLAGLTDIVWHDLRHEAISRLTETGLLTMTEIAMFSGHRDIQMLQSYTHLRAETIVVNLKEKGL